MEWYIKKGITLNLNHFLQRAIDSGDWTKETISKEEFQQLLFEKIEAVEMKYIKADIRRFIKNEKDIEIWTTKYFNDLVKLLRIED
jgi:hypothetical protein